MKDFSGKERHFEIKYPHFVFYVRDQLERKFGADRLYRGGFNVITTLDANDNPVAYFEATPNEAERGMTFGDRVVQSHRLQRGLIRSRLSVRVTQACSSSSLRALASDSIGCRWRTCSNLGCWKPGSTPTNSRLLRRRGAFSQAL